VNNFPFTEITFCHGCVITATFRACFVFEGRTKFPQNCVFILLLLMMIICAALIQMKFLPNQSDHEFISFFLLPNLSARHVRSVGVLCGSMDPSRICTSFSSACAHYYLIPIEIRQWCTLCMSMMHVFVSDVTCLLVLLLLYMESSSIISAD
jgi:hypothetical protein